MASRCPCTNVPQHSSSSSTASKLSFAPASAKVIPQLLPCINSALFSLTGPIHDRKAVGQPMNLPWSPKLPVINLSGFHFEPMGTKPWKVLAPRSEEEWAALKRSLGLAAILKHLAIGFKERRAKIADRQEDNCFEFYSRLEKAGVTPSGDIIAVESQMWVLNRVNDGQWLAYICPQVNYQELEKDFDAKQARIRAEIQGASSLNAFE
jgi:hypothetical protein